jgi:tetratricopeptide (TPR) repeat protein
MKKILLTTLASLIIFPLSNAYAITDMEVYEAYKNSYNYERMYRYQDSIKVLAGVYKQYKATYTINLRLGWLYYLSGNYANSTFHYLNAIKTAPNNVEAKLGYMVPLLAQQRYLEAEEIGYRIMKIDNYNYYGNYRIISALKNQKKYSEAEKIIIKMLLIYPTDTVFLTELAGLKDLKGDKKEALKIAKSIITLDPTNVFAGNYIKYKK